MKQSPREVGQKIRLIRKENGLTMEEFGNLIGGVKKSAVGNWERGDNFPNNERLKRISEIGNVTVDYLLNGAKQVLDPKLVTFDVLGIRANSKKRYEDTISYSFSIVVSCKAKDNIIHGVLNSTFTLNRRPLDNNPNNPIFTAINYSIPNSDEINVLYDENHFKDIDFEQISFSQLCKSINEETTKTLMDRLLKSQINIVRSYRGSAMISGSGFLYDILIDWLNRTQLKYEFDTKGDITTFKGFLISEE